MNFKYIQTNTIEQKYNTEKAYCKICNKRLHIDNYYNENDEYINETDFIRNVVIYYECEDCDSKTNSYIRKDIKIKYTKERV